jgi:hypothetical protein
MTDCRTAVYLVTTCGVFRISMPAFELVPVFATARADAPLNPGHR